MRATLLRLNISRVHNPRIHFVGKRSWPTGVYFYCSHISSAPVNVNLILIICSDPEPTHAHPAAPADLKKSFDNFLKKFKSSSSSSSSTPAKSDSNGGSSGATVYDEYWKAPSRLWNPRGHELGEAEIEAVIVRVVFLPCPLNHTEGTTDGWCIFELIP